MLVHTLDALESLGTTPTERAAQLRVPLRSYFRYRREAKVGRLSLSVHKLLHHPSIVAALLADALARSSVSDSHADCGVSYYSTDSK